ncbi:MAG TPA: S41 family peptidase, partial [Vicinamibacterales bacterium]|nr:S41 family peptidase [Vicinamibacterales bacterium]
MTISAPVIAFAVVGGFLGKAMAREDTYQHLKIFDDVVSLIMSNYVEQANVDKVMRGAMHGLADGLDPDSAYLTADEVKQIEAGTPLAPGDVGIDLTRQYYLRVIATRDDSPAAKAGIRTGDYIRAINETPTREMSVWEGMRALRGATGSKVTVTVIRGNAADPHVIDLVRAPVPAGDITGRIAAPGVGYVRITAIANGTAGRLRTQIQDLTKNGAAKWIIDIRRTSGGQLETGLELARLFVASGTLAMREIRGGARDTIAAAAGDGTITQPAVLLVDAGTSAAAELFASALVGNKRAELIGEHTIGRAAMQKLVKLPDGAGLWLSTSRYLTPSGAPLHEKGLEPTVAVDEP